MGGCCAGVVQVFPICGPCISPFLSSPPRRLSELEIKTLTHLGTQDDHGSGAAASSAKKDEPVTSLCEAHDFVEAERAAEAETERRRRERHAEWLQSGGWDISETGGTIGLRNLRNTCWMNATLQCLAHLEPFTAHLFDRDFEADCPTLPPPMTPPRLSREDSRLSRRSSPGGPLPSPGEFRTLSRRGPMPSPGERTSRRTSSKSPSPPAPPPPPPTVAIKYQEFLQALWKDRQRKPYNPQALHVAMGKAAPWFFRPNTRHDSLEFLNLFLNTLDDQLVLAPISRQPHVEVDVDGCALASSPKNWARQLKGAKNPVKSLFEGRLRSTLTCSECGHTSERLDPFQHLSLDVQCEALETRCLDQSLAEYASEEILAGSNQWFCERCDRKVDATKRIELHELPPILVIHFKRFTYDFSTQRVKKMFANVTLPDDQLTGLDLHELAGTAKKSQARYDIVAIVNHVGRDAISGHYTANCRHCVDDHWYAFDDERVDRLDETKVWIPQAAYVVWLMRRSGASEPS